MQSIFLSFCCIKGYKEVILELSRAIFATSEIVPEIKIHTTETRDGVRERGVLPWQKPRLPLRELNHRSKSSPLCLSKSGLCCTYIQPRILGTSILLSPFSCWSLICPPQSMKHPCFFLLCLGLTIWCHQPLTLSKFKQTCTKVHILRLWFLHWVCPFAQCSWDMHYSNEQLLSLPSQRLLEALSPKCTLAEFDASWEYSISIQKYKI